MSRISIAVFLLLALCACRTEKNSRVDHKVVCDPGTGEAYFVQPGVGDISFIQPAPSANALCKKAQS